MRQHEAKTFVSCISSLANKQQGLVCAAYQGSKHALQKALTGGQSNSRVRTGVGEQWAALIAAGRSQLDLTGV